MDVQFIRDTILRGVETRRVEFKQSMDFKEKATKAKVAKGCIGLANTRDGGFLIIGLRKSSTDQHDPEGVKADHLGGYTQDRVASVVMSYAEPPVRLTVAPVQFEDDPLVAGRTFLVIQVFGFSEIPVICKKSYQDENLFEGGLYIRSLERFETRQVKTEAEMRELLDLATERRLRAHLELTERAGGVVVTPASISQDTRKRFEEEAKDILS